MGDVLDKPTEERGGYEVDEAQLQYDIISVLGKNVADKIFHKGKIQENYVNMWVFYIGKYEKYIDEDLIEIFQYVEINEIESFFQALDQLSREKNLEDYNAMILTVSEIRQFNEYLQGATISSDISKLKDFIGEQIQENPSIDYLVDKAIDASKVTTKHLDKKEIDKESLKRMFSDIEELFYEKLQNNFEGSLSKDTIHNMSTGYVLYLLETFNESTNEEREKLEYSFQEFISGSMPNKFVDWMGWIGSIPRLSKFFKNIENTTDKLKAQIHSKNITPANSEQVSQLNNPIEFKDLLLITEQGKDMDLTVDPTEKKVDRLAVVVDVNTRENIKKLATTIDNKAVGTTIFLGQSLKFSIDNLKHEVETEDIWNKIQFLSKNSTFGESIRSIINFFIGFLYKDGLDGYERTMKNNMAKKYNITFASFLEEIEDFDEYIIDIKSTENFYFDDKIVDYIGDMQYMGCIKEEEPKGVFNALFQKKGEFSIYLEENNISILKEGKLDIALLKAGLKSFVSENKSEVIENVTSSMSFKSYDELLQKYPKWEQYTGLIEKYSTRLVVPTNVALQLFVKENFQADSTITNPYGTAHGLTQITDETWDFITGNLGKKYGIDLNWSRENPEHQIAAAMVYLKYQYDRYGDWGHSIVAYHTGSLNFSDAKAIKYAKDNPAVSKGKNITDNDSYIEAYKEYLLS